MTDNFNFHIEEFPCFDSEKILPILSKVAEMIEDATQCKPTHRLEIGATQAQPTLLGMVSDTDSFHLMLLNIRDTSNLKDWIYQFSHEYIHHILNQCGKRNMPPHFLWFEEMLCQISSLYFLQLSQHLGLVEDSPVEAKVPLDPSCAMVYEWLENALQKGKGVYSCIQPLTIAGGNPPGFSVVPAYHCFETFQKHPCLWRIVRHLSNLPPEWDWQTTVDALRNSEDTEEYHLAQKELFHILFP